MGRIWMVAMLLVACGQPEEPGPVPLAEPLVFCAPDLTDSEKELSARIWGATEDCDDQSAIRVGVRSLDGSGESGEDLLGQAWLDTGEIWLDPAAWDRDPAITLAHELGHFAGFGHTSGYCDLMFNGFPSGCGDLSVAGRTYSY